MKLCKAVKKRLYPITYKIIPSETKVFRRDGHSVVRRILSLLVDKNHEKV